MAKTLQLRDVPDTVHRTVKARAALAGMSLSEYLLAEVKQLAARPTVDELRARVRRRPRVELPAPAAVLVREERDRR